MRLLQTRLQCVCFVVRLADEQIQSSTLAPLVGRYLYDILLFCRRFAFFFFFICSFTANSHLAQRTTKTSGGDVDDDGVVYTKNYYKILISSAGYVCVCVCTVAAGRGKENWQCDKYTRVRIISSAASD